MESNAHTQLPWTFLDKWRGSTFKGEWPTLPEMFSITVERFPDRPCFTDFDPEKQTLTYSQVMKNVADLAQWLRSMGVDSGDRIAVSGKNSPEWATVYLATLFAGAIIIPIDYGLHDVEINNLLKASEPKIFFVDEEKIEYFKQNPHTAQIFSLHKKYSETYVYNLKTTQTYPITQAKESDVAAILFTSGTTGNPKGVMLTHHNFVSDCYIAQCNLDLFETDVFYALLPIHHSYTMLAVFIESLSVGAEIVFAKTMAVSRMLKELREGKITMLLGVPLLFNKLLAGILKGIRDKGVIVYGIMKLLMNLSYIIKKITGINPGHILFKTVLEKASISTLRIAICGGGPLAASVFRIYQELGIDFIQGYGLTETSPIVALNPVKHFKIESVGNIPSPWIQVRVLDPNEHGIGEIAFKGPMVMKGYYNMPEETKEVLSDDGWLKTGDLGWVDNENYLYLAGRAKNMIVTEGGKNVYPEEIENEFQLYTEIEQITIQGYLIDTAMKSESLEALVYPSDDLIKKLHVTRNQEGSLPVVYKEIEEIIEKANKNLQPYQRITRITILPEALEMTTTKKVKRTYTK